MKHGAGWPMGPCELARPGRHRRARARRRGVWEKLREPRMAAAAAPRRDAQRRAARPQERPRLLHVRLSRATGRRGHEIPFLSKASAPIGCSAPHRTFTVRSIAGHVIGRYSDHRAANSRHLRSPGSRFSVPAGALAVSENVGRRHARGQERERAARRPGRDARDPRRRDRPGHRHGKIVIDDLTPDDGFAPGGDGIQLARTQTGDTDRDVRRRRHLPLPRRRRHVPDHDLRLGRRSRRERPRHRRSSPARPTPRRSDGRYSLNGADFQVAACHADEAAVGRRADGCVRITPRMATKPQTVLVVEDEASIASFVAAYLKNAGYAVRTTASGAEALKLVASEKPALVVLDLMLPDMDGVEVCKRIRQTHRPAGADADGARRGRRQDHRARGRRRRLHDEAVQPARARCARARDPAPRDDRAREGRERGARATATSPSTQAGARRASASEEIQLAPKEFDLLWELLDHRGLVLTRDQLLERVWGYTFAGDTRTVDVHVRQLRRKLGDASPIVTVWGVGYKVSPAREQHVRLDDSRLAPCSGRCASGCRRSSCSVSCSPGWSRR